MPNALLLEASDTAPTHAQLLLLCLESNTVLLQQPIHDIPLPDIVIASV
jgi:hypothetical protein